MTEPSESDLDVAVRVYLAAADGDPGNALRLALRDLIQVRNAAEAQARDLSKWISRGFVRGLT